MVFQSDFPLKELTSFGVDAKAKYFTNPCSTEQIIEICQSEYVQNKNYLIMGNGSNLLFKSDFDGLVIKPILTGIEKIKESDKYVYLTVKNGENWDEFVQYTLNNEYYGLENLSYIPGNVGASSVQNIGAYGVEASDLIECVTVLDLKTTKIMEFSNSECQFGYRNSIFKDSSNLMVLSVTFKLSKFFTPVLTYSGLQKQFHNRPVITAQQIRQTIIQIRQDKLPDPEKYGNGGSFFKNPIGTRNKVNALKKFGDDLPYYQISDNQFKIPAAFLIDRAGLKGVRHGQVGTYQKQPLVIINYGNASGDDIYRFSQYIKNEVANKFDILLKEEVNII